MAVSKRGSRKIIVGNIEFCWKATGNDGWISVVIWPADSDITRLVGTFEYHSEFEEKENDKGYYSRTKGQIIITNRVIRKIIEHVGIEKIVKLKGQINLGRLEDIYNIDNALREPIDLYVD